MQLHILQYNFELSEAILEISKSYGGKKSNSPDHPLGVYDDCKIKREERPSDAVNSF